MYYRYRYLVALVQPVLELEKKIEGGFKNIKKTLLKFAVYNQCGTKYQNVTDIRISDKTYSLNITYTYYNILYNINNYVSFPLLIVFDYRGIFCIMIKYVGRYIPIQHQVVLK